jgi:uncharacterized membrane protein
MGERLIAMFSGLPPELATMLIAAIPLVESRLSIPVAIGLLGLSPLQALFWSCLGNALPVVLVYALLPLVLREAPRFPRIHRLVERYFHRLRHEHERTANRWGSLALFVFVVVPSPGTGVWSATVLALLLRIHPRYALPAILGGMVVASVALALIVTGVVHGYEFLNPLSR